MQVAERVKELHSNDIDIKRTNERHGDYKGKHVSNSKARKLLGWKPLVSFKEGSKKLYDFKNAGMKLNER